MEPVSVAASLLTVLAAAVTAGRALERLCSARLASKNLAALVNEVSVFVEPAASMECLRQPQCQVHRLEGSAEQCAPSCSRASRDLTGLWELGPHHRARGSNDNKA